MIKFISKVKVLSVRIILQNLIIFNMWKVLKLFLKLDYDFEIIFKSYTCEARHTSSGNILFPGWGKK